MGRNGSHTAGCIDSTMSDTARHGHPFVPPEEVHERPFRAVGEDLVNHMHEVEQDGLPSTINGDCSLTNKYLQE